MSGVGHTAGPWKVVVHTIPDTENGEIDRTDDWTIYGSDDQSICYEGGALEAAANVRLITAAPELLEAVRLFVAYDDHDEADMGDVGMMLRYAEAINAARTAIAKATDA